MLEIEVHVFDDAQKTMKRKRTSSSGRTRRANNPDGRPSKSVSRLFTSALPA